MKGCAFGPNRALDFGLPFAKATADKADPGPAPGSGPRSVPNNKGLPPHRAATRYVEPPVATGP